VSFRVPEQVRRGRSSVRPRRPFGVGDRTGRVGAVPARRGLTTETGRRIGPGRDTVRDA
jgi:hypothetical protein